MHKACKKNKTSFAVALLQVLPIVGYVLASVAWLGGEDSFIFADQQLHWFILAAGIVFGRMAVRQIIIFRLIDCRLKLYWRT